MDFTPVSAGFVLDAEICLKQNILWEIGTCQIQFTEIRFFLQRLGFFLYLHTVSFFFLIVELLTANSHNIWTYRAFPAVSHSPNLVKSELWFYFFIFLRWYLHPLQVVYEWNSSQIWNFELVKIISTDSWCHIATFRWKV